MWIVGGFWVAFVVTVLLLVASLASGLSGRRRLHLWTGPLTMVGLLVAVLLTEQLVANYTFPDDRKRVHLVLAKTAGLLALPVIATGLWLWRAPAARRWHRWSVWLFVVATLAATGTGLWMFAAAEPIVRPG